jgi:hypothetical protein
MVQINKVKEHSPQEGKNKWLNLVFCSNASSVPRSEWGRKVGCCSTKAFSKLVI